MLLVYIKRQGLVGTEHPAPRKDLEGVFFPFEEIQEVTALATSRDKVVSIFETPDGLMCAHGFARSGAAGWLVFSGKPPRLPNGYQPI